jgi:hypothetical protein
METSEVTTCILLNPFIHLQIDGLRRSQQRKQSKLSNQVMFMRDIMLNSQNPNLNEISKPHVWWTCTVCMSSSSLGIQYSFKTLKITYCCMRGYLQYNTPSRPWRLRTVACVGIYKNIYINFIKWNKVKSLCVNKTKQKMWYACL